jgi:hypothetical protein
MSGSKCTLNLVLCWAGVELNISTLLIFRLSGNDRFASQLILSQIASYM